MGKYHVLLKKGERIIGRDPREFSRERAQQRMQELNQRQKGKDIRWVVERK